MKRHDPLGRAFAVYVTVMLLAPTIALVVYVKACETTEMQP